MHALYGIEVFPMTSPPEAVRARVRTAAIAVTGIALVAGAIAGIRDPHWTLLAVAVIFGWSQISGA
jgi:hypothetical protein